MSRTFRSVVVAIVTIGVVAGFAVVAPQPARAAPNYDQVIDNEAYWISLAQIPSTVAGSGRGGLAQYPDAGTREIRPYLANRGAVGMLLDRNSDGSPSGRYFPMVLAYVDWYFRHLNGDPTAGLPLDYNGDTGTVYDYDVNVATGAETYAPDPATGHTPSYDSTDAYAGTFLTLIRQLAEADPAADSYIRSKSTQLSEIAGAAISTRQSTYLTGARPDYLAEYLMDNVEVYSGLQDYVWVLTNVLNDPTDATTWNKSFGKERDAITASLSHAATSQMYCWAADQCSSTNWNTFYSASVSQLWPINAGIATGSRAHSLWTTFKTDWSTCAATAVCDLGSPWAVIALTAANQGDTTAVDSYINGAQTNWINSGRPWPWSVADSADLASAAAIESP